METKLNYYSSISITPIKSENKWRVNEELTYYTSPNIWVQKFVIPKGFLTDWITLPKSFAPLYWLLWGRMSIDVLPGVILHDYLCETKQVSREMADLAFRDCLEERGLSRKRVRIFYYAVKLFGLIKFKETYFKGENFNI